jgi:hypothetical protein
MSGAIPTSTSVTESAVINGVSSCWVSVAKMHWLTRDWPAPLSHVWHFIKLQDFNKFWSALDKSEHSKGTSEETDVVKWQFKDGTVIEVKQEEHSSLNHYITYSVITANPALSYTSAVSTIRCYAVTSGENENSTFVQWTGNFSSDADAGTFWLCPGLKPKR